MKRFALLAAMMVLLVLLVPATVSAQSTTTTFQWDLSTSEPLGVGGGYNLYASKQSGVYSAANIVGSVGEGVNTITLDTSAYRGRWYFVCTAFATAEDGTNLESGYSNEVSATYTPNGPQNLRISVP